MVSSLCCLKDSKDSSPIPQFKNINSSAFSLQLSHPYMTTGKTIALIIQTFFSKVMYLLCNILSRFVIALTTQTFVGKVMSLLFNMLSGFVIASKERTSFNFMAAVTICSDFGAPKNKV